MNIHKSFEPRYEKTCFFAYAKKAQISCAVVTAQLISAFIFATQIPSTSQNRNVKLLAIFCGCTARFVSELVENSEDQYSRDMDHFLSIDIKDVQQVLGRLILCCVTVLRPTNS